MKKTQFASFVAAAVLCSMTVSAAAVGNGSVSQTKTQSQTCLTTGCEADREQARDRLRTRLQICDEAKLQQQSRLQQQDQTQSGFNDTEQHWANAQICSAYHWGLINGYPDRTFNPDGTIVGVEGVLMMSRMMNGISGDEELPVSDETIDWEQVPQWAREQLQEETALRIAAQSQCYGEGQMNRLQFAVMLAKTLGLEPEELTEDTVVFTDQDEIPGEELGYIARLRTLGIIEGCDGAFYPSQAVTRAEAATMLTRVMDLLEEA